ncbi:MAG TPA: rod shape-determining protein RodA [Steroidobacteraceae bacterium]|nr:rod shape-determining protein RodA [Steroidobacteraceae bacterium]
MPYEDFGTSRSRRTFTVSTAFLRRLHIDEPLLLGLLAIICFGLVVLYSASGQNIVVVRAQALRFGLAIAAMVVIANVHPRHLRMISVPGWVLGVLLLIVVAVVGHVGKGAQRWLDLGFMRFQPSELMKLAVPLACAWYLHERPLPPRFQNLLIPLAFTLVPTALIMEQPDLGTALLILASGALVILMAGLRIWVIVVALVLVLVGGYIGWEFMHDYQRQRILTFLNPQSDPLGSGYHIIQSQIAIGSGGVFGKGWMNGSQAQLEFLPERSTDFIFAVIGEEFGLLGLLLLIGLYLFVIGRTLFMAFEAQDTFARLVAGSLSITFFVYVFVNTGMVSGLLPVVGVPLPLVSYGGSSMVTLMAGFGILMSLHSHRKLVGS